MCVPDVGCALSHLASSWRRSWRRVVAAMRHWREPVSRQWAMAVREWVLRGCKEVASGRERRRRTIVPSVASVRSEAEPRAPKGAVRMRVFALPLERVWMASAAGWYLSVLARWAARWFSSSPHLTSRITTVWRVAQSHPGGWGVGAWGWKRRITPSGQMAVDPSARMLSQRSPGSVRAGGRMVGRAVVAHVWVVEVGEGVGAARDGGCDGPGNSADPFIVAVHDRCVREGGGGADQEVGGWVWAAAVRAVAPELREAGSEEAEAQE